MVYVWVHQYFIIIVFPKKLTNKYTKKEMHSRDATVLIDLL